jgi:hypothetical protein
MIVETGEPPAVGWAGFGGRAYSRAAVTTDDPLRDPTDTDFAIFLELGS